MHAFVGLVAPKATVKSSVTSSRRRKKP